MTISAISQGYREEPYLNHVDLYNMTVPPDPNIAILWKAGQSIEM
jgi:hypothetical protein